MNLTDDKLMAAIYAGLLMGTGIGLVIKVGGSTGGMDIPPIILNKLFGLSIPVMIYVGDTALLLIQALYSSTEQVLYGILVVLLTSIVMDKILIMGQKQTQVMVVSPKYEEINQMIHQKIDRGSTLIHAMTGLKKLIYSIIGLLMFAGCEDDYKTDITIPMSGIYLSSPAEGATMDLNDESKDSYEFTWDKASEQGSVLIFSTTKDLVKQVTVEAGTGKNCNISALVINQLLSKLDIKSGNERLIYWTVKDKNNQTAAASEVRTLQARRMKSILLAPEDMSTATLLADATQTKIKFEWDASGIGNDTECTVLLSLDPEMDNFVELPTKGTGNISITHEEMEQTIEKLSIKRYRTNTIYWNVRNNADQSLISRVANTLYTNDMMRLVDKRGDETITYPVVRVTFSDGTSQVWTAQNLNTTKYPDGTEIEAEYYRYAPESLGEDWIKAIGTYYSFVIRDRIIPKGWRIPTEAEWNYLFSEAGKNGGYNVLKDPVYYYKDPTGQEHLNEWGLSFTSAGTWNLDRNAIELAQEKFYFMAADLGDPATWNDPWRALIHDNSETLWVSWAKGTVMRYIYAE